MREEHRSKLMDSICSSESEFLNFKNLKDTMDSDELKMFLPVSYMEVSEKDEYVMRLAARELNFNCV